MYVNDSFIKFLPSPKTLNIFLLLSKWTNFEERKYLYTQHKIPNRITSNKCKLLIRHRNNDTMDYERNQAMHDDIGNYEQIAYTLNTPTTTHTEYFD